MKYRTERYHLSAAWPLGAHGYARAWLKDRVKSYILLAVLLLLLLWAVYVSKSTATSLRNAGNTWEAMRRSAVIPNKGCMTCIPYGERVVGRMEWRMLLWWRKFTTKTRMIYWRFAITTQWVAITTKQDGWKDHYT